MSKLLPFFESEVYLQCYRACVPMQSVLQPACDFANHDFANNFLTPPIYCITNDGLETVALMKKMHIVKTKKDIQWLSLR